jgi:hypothetical protein
VADNINVTPGSGKTIAGDDVSGVLHQRVKISLGADGSATDALGGAGAVAPGVQRITLASDDPAVTTLSSVATSAKQDALAALVGEVQASPTANTILDRLKALLTGIALATGSNVIGKVGVQVGGNDVADAHPLPVVEGNSAAPITGASMPAGGVGLTGWLSAIWSRLGSAATAAKQPALGTAGTASSDVITVQGIASAVAISTTVMGGTPVHYLSAASTNQTNVKASAGTLLNVTAINTTATVYYLKLHDTASTPTAGTTAVVQCYAIPASTSGNGFTISVPMTFSIGIAFTLVGGIADNDTSNAATGVTVDFVYR